MPSFLHLDYFSLSINSKYILEDHIFALFLHTVYTIEKLLAGFNVQPRIIMNQSLI